MSVCFVGLYVPPVALPFSQVLCLRMSLLEDQQLLQEVLPLKVGKFQGVLQA